MERSMPLRSRRILIGSIAASTLSIRPQTARAQFSISRDAQFYNTFIDLRYFSIEQRIFVQQGSGWRRLRLPQFPAYPEQAAPGGLLPDDLDADPSRIDRRIELLVERLLAESARTRSGNAGSRLTLIPSGPPSRWLHIPMEDRKSVV